VFGLTINKIHIHCQVWGLGLG